MTTQALQPVTSRAAWRGDKLVKNEADWIYLLSDEEVKELETLGTRFVEENPDLRFVQASDYPLTVTAEAVKKWCAEVDGGRGFTLVRGLRTHVYSDALSAAIYYILGLHMGEPFRQNEMGDLIDHIYATSDKKLEEPDALSKSIRDKLPFHSDSSDVVSLMCLRPSKEGGASCLVSGAEIYNEILKRRPDLAPLLFEDFNWDWRRQDPEAPADTYTSPILDVKDGVMNMYAGSIYIKTAQEYPGIPALTQDQIDLLDLFEEITYEPGMAIEMDFRPGDIQWLSNYAALHSRTEFIDFPEPQRRRHLMRLWLQREGARPVSEGFGKNAVVQKRGEHRKEEDADNRGKFTVDLASVPRMD